MLSKTAFLQNALNFGWEHYFDTARCILSPQIAQGAYYFLRYWKVHITSSDSARYILFPQIRGKIGHKHGNSHICAQRKISRGQDPMKICGFPALICPISLAGFQEISRNPLKTPINTSQISKIIVNRSIFPPEHDQDWAKQGKFPWFLPRPKFRLGRNIRNRAFMPKKNRYATNLLRRRRTRSFRERSETQYFRERSATQY